MSTWREHRIDTTSDVLAVIAELSRNYSLIFRGQSRDWPVIPSLQRLFDQSRDPSEIPVWESAIIQNFRRHAQAHLPPHHAPYLSTMLGTLTLMQHYGAPTRLIDWTFSPWVAAYFAAAASPEHDGIILAFDRDHLSRDQHWGILAAPDQVPSVLAGFNALTGAKNVSEWIKHSPKEIPVFASFIYEFADPRISAQQSLFTLSGTLGTNHAEELAARLPEGKLFRIVVPAATKADLTHLLWRMNIGPLSLFPGMDGVGRFVTDAVRNHLPLDHAGRAWVLRETNDGRDLGLAPEEPPTKKARRSDAAGSPASSASASRRSTVAAPAPSRSTRRK